MPKDAVIKVLNDLVEVSEDGKKGFAEAADLAEDPKLKQLFALCAEDCRAAAQEMQEKIAVLGGEPTGSGSAAGAVHRGWVKVKASVENKDIAVLEEVERGEDHAKAAFGKALRSDLPPDIRALVQKHYDGTIQHHDQVRELRDRFKSGLKA